MGGGAALREVARRELDEIRAGALASPARIRAGSEVLERYRQWCRRALAHQHLVTVAAALADTAGWPLEDLAAVGLPVDLLECFPAWRRGSRRGFQAPPSGLAPPPAGAAEPLGTLRLQLSPGSLAVPYALRLLRDLLRRTDPAVRLMVAVEPGANLQGLRSLVGQFSATAAERVSLAELRAATLFAQDNARAARDAAGRPVLLIPREFRRGDHRAEDELEARGAARALGVPVVQSRLFWEGGNLVHDGRLCWVGVDTIAENMVRLGLAAREVRRLLAAKSGAEVRMLGDLARARYDAEQQRLPVSGQASFHIDLDVCLPGRLPRRRRPLAFVADAARGLDLLPAALARRSLAAGHFVPPRRARALIEAEYRACAAERHPRLLGYAAALEEAGYRVVGIPDLRTDPEQNLFRPVNLDFGYCNVLTGLWRGRPAVYYLPWGVRILDAAAERRWRAAGLHPVRVSTPRIANALMALQGGLHCFCGQI